MYREIHLLQETFAALKRLKDVEETVQQLLRQVREEDASLEPSRVHRRGADVVDLSRRRSFSRSGRCPEVLEFLQSTLLPEIRRSFDGGLELYSGHYDLVAYPVGGFFARHVDYVSAFGPGLRCWHTLVCLAAPGCEGGQTLVDLGEGLPPHASSCAATPGCLLSILAGTPHEGAPVTRGKKVLLKFEFFEFSDLARGLEAAAEAGAGDVVRCICSDGAVDAPLRLLLKQEFFQKLVRFDKGSDGCMQLGGFRTRDLQDLLGYLEAAGGAPGGGGVDGLQGVFEFICAPERLLRKDELQALAERGFATTRERGVAERFSALDGLEYAFVGCLQEWTVDVENVWDLLLDFEVLDRHVFYPQIALVAAGQPICSVGYPGRRQLVSAERRASLPLHGHLPGAKLEVFEEDPDVCGEDTLSCMQALLRAQVAGARPPALPPSCEGRRAAPLGLSVRQSKALAARFLRKSSPEELKVVLQTFVGKQTSSETVYETCNDGESFLAVTLYKTRIYAFEWALFRRSALLDL
jgi:hypothetical protein